MKHNFLVVVLTLTLIAMLLSACGGPPSWQIASEGDSCTPAEVIDRDWDDTDRRVFYLLLKANDGEIGEASVTAYQYDSLKIGDTTCIVR